MLKGQEFKDQFLKLIGNRDLYQWAKKHHLHKGVIEKILSGKIPELPYLIKISRALNTTVDALLTGQRVQQEYSEEEQEYIEKVVKVLRSTHEASKASLKNAIHIYYCLICDE